MWYVMESAQQNYHLSERLIRAISNWRTFAGANDDVEHLIDLGADVNGIHGTLLPLHCACMVSDSSCLRLLLQKGARVNSLDHVDVVAIKFPSSVIGFKPRTFQSKVGALSTLPKRFTLTASQQGKDVISVIAPLPASYSLSLPVHRRHILRHIVGC